MTLANFLRRVRPRLLGPRVASVTRQVAWLALLGIGSVQAASLCYSDRDYPAIGDLQATPSGYRIVLSGIFREGRPDAPVLEFSQETGWRTAGRVPCANENDCVKETQGCKAQLPAIRLSRDEARRILGRETGEEIEQSVSACVEQGQYVYFGIGFYRGEGSDGVGGIGRYDRSTGKMEIRRPPRLLETSVTHLAHDGKYLWIGTGNQYECIGRVPTEGLLRYDWDRGTIERWRDPPTDTMCGLMVRGMLVRDGKLIVATDVGLAIRESGGEYPEWHHYVPDLKAPGLMRETKCDELYTHLLRTVGRESGPGDSSSFSQLYYALAKRDSRLLEQFVRAGVKPELKDAK